jgi:ribosome-associated translation inhibitor RaiA
MQIQINTHPPIDSSEARDEWARGAVESELSHLSEHFTRVEVYFSDENAGKGAAVALRCTAEARMNGRAPVAVTNDAASFDAALNGAVQKLARAIEHAIGRIDKHAHDPRQLPVEDTLDDDFVPSSEPF